MTYIRRIFRPRALLLAAMVAGHACGAAASEAQIEAYRRERVARPAITVANVSKVAELVAFRDKGWRVRWHPQGNEFGLLEFKSKVEIFDAKTLRPIEDRSTGDEAFDFAFSPAGDATAVSTDGSLVTVSYDGKRSPLGIHEKSLQSDLAFSPDGKFLATGGYGSPAKLWSLTDGSLVRTFDANDGAGGLTLRFSPDGKLLAVGNRNYQTRLFRTSDGTVARTLTKALSQDLRFSADGRVLAIGYVDATIGLWDPADGSLITSFPSRTKEVFALAWLPGADVLVSGGLEGPIVFWKIDGRHVTPLCQLPAPERVFSLAFSPDGRLLISAGNTKTQIWGIPAERSSGAGK